jgi:hypothetical protein
MLEQCHQQRAGDALSSGEESEQKIPSGSCSYDTMESHRVPLCTYIQKQRCV